jgi:uncharacterized protein YkwD
MRSLARRLPLIGLVVALALALLPAATASAATVSTTAIAAAERTAFELANARRASAGLIALKLDPRLAALARDRAEYMATTGTFSHTQADGTNVFDLMDMEGIRWYGAGEIIAWNTAADLGYSADFAVKGWMGSSGHKAIMLSTNYNYVGFGLAISPTTGKRYWAGVYLKGPDRTGAWAKVGSTSATPVDASSAKVTVKWTGNDTRLQVLTSGLSVYQAQRRTDGGAWVDYGTMTATSLTKTLAKGHVHDIRVRARDKAGNWGAWNQVTVRP